MTTTTNKRITLLHSLSASPSHSSHLILPSDLHDTLTTSLFTTSNSITNIQSAISSSLESSGWSAQLGNYILDTLRKEPGLGERELLQRVLSIVKSGFLPSPNGAAMHTALGKEMGEASGKGKSKRDDEEDTGETDAGVEPKLKAPTRKTIDAGIAAVRKELGKTCEVVQDEWED